MTSIAFPSVFGTECFDMPDAQNYQNVPVPAAFAFYSFPTNTVGTTNVTFKGINANSEIRVYLADQTELAGVELCTANQLLSWPVYAPGSPNNNVTIRIVHMAYKIKEFDYESAVGNQSIPVQQERDLWYKNPV